MPLSKARMQARKRQDRAKNRFDTGFTTAPVKPKQVDEEVYLDYDLPARPELDADGNPMPDYY